MVTYGRVGSVPALRVKIKIQNVMRRVCFYGNFLISSCIVLLLFFSKSVRLRHVFGDTYDDRPPTWQVIKNWVKRDQWCAVRDGAIVFDELWRSIYRNWSFQWHFDSISPFRVRSTHTHTAFNANFNSTHFHSFRRMLKYIHLIYFQQVSPPKKNNADFGKLIWLQRYVWCRSAHKRQEK